jgi:serine/threonine protein kinase
MAQAASIVMRCLQVYLITELVTGGELLEAVLQRGSYSEGEARLAFVQLLRGIQYLHSKWVLQGADCVLTPLHASLQPLLAAGYRLSC